MRQWRRDVPGARTTLDERALGADDDDEAWRVASPVARIAAHYRRALRAAFGQRGHTHALLIEDDLVLSAAFLNYFAQLLPALDADDAAFCVSAWNDDGVAPFALNASVVRRTSYFPGLGWALSARTYAQRRIDERWPAEHWDHHVRYAGVMRNAADYCLQPAVSLVHTVGVVGANTNFATWHAHHRRVRLSHASASTRFFVVADENLATAETCVFSESLVAGVQQLVLAYIDEHEKRSGSALAGATDVADRNYFDDSDDAARFYTCVYERVTRLKSVRTSLRTRLSERALALIVNGCGAGDGDERRVALHYQLQQWPLLAAALGLWSPPRAHYMHTHVLETPLLQLALVRKELAAAPAALTPPFVAARGVACEPSCTDRLFLSFATCDSLRSFKICSECAYAGPQNGSAPSVDDGGVCYVAELFASTCSATPIDPKQRRICP